MRRAVAAIALLLVLGGCRQKMANQPRYDPLESSDFFADGMASRPRIAGTVARGALAVDSFVATGKINGQEADGYPFAITADDLDRGQERYNIYCSECHGRLGDGNGMIPSRGYRRPPSFHTESLRTAKTGHFFDVMTNGFGSMPPYAPQVPVNDRWKIVAYIRALQLSQNGTINDLPADQRAKLEGSGAMTADVTTRETGTGIGRFQMPALIIGVVFGAISIAGFFLAGPKEFYRAYLPSYLFWWAIALGSLAVLMLQYVTGGEWGLMIRRPLGAASRSLWLMGLLFIPVFLGMHDIFPWMDAEWVSHHPVVKLKTQYLNSTRFIAFAVAYFLIWCLWAWRLRGLSLRFYEDRAPETDLKRRKWAAIGLLMIVLTISFAAIDWMMSLEPAWTSTMYPLIILIGCALSAFVFVTFFLTRLATTPAMGGILKSSHLRDLGNLMLAFVMLYAYTTFSEFLLIWYANLKEEVPHYLHRQHGTWGVLAGMIVVFHFFLPFFLLLMRQIKDNPRTIGVVAIIILVMRYIAIYWLVAPSWYGEHFHYHWINFTTLIAVGGIWMFEFIRQLKGQTIIPIHETWVEEAIREGAVKINA